MGYYSQEAISMLKETFESLLEEAKKKEDEHDAYKCLTEYCNEYYVEDWQESTRYDKKNHKWIKEGPIKQIVTLVWYEIKRYSNAMGFIEEYITENGGAYSYAGEEFEDIGNVWSNAGNPYNDKIKWYESIETCSYVDVKCGTKTINTYRELLKELNDNEPQDCNRKTAK